MAGTTTFPSAVDEWSKDSPTDLDDADSEGRVHSERHDDLEAAMEAVQTHLIGAFASASLPAGWSWVNQGDSTYWERADGLMALRAVGTGGTTNTEETHRMLVKTYSAETTVDVVFHQLSLLPQQGKWLRAALVLRNSTDGKYLAFGLASEGNPGIQINTWTAPGTWSGSEPVSTGGVIITENLHLRAVRNSATSWDFHMGAAGTPLNLVLAGWDPSSTYDQVGVLCCTPSGTGRGRTAFASFEVTLTA